MEIVIEAARQDATCGKVVANIFHDEGWTVQTTRNGGDLVVARRGRKYAVELKFSSEGRRDRLIPLLSQAILQAQALVKRSGSASLMPLAVVGASRISPAVAEDVRRFVEEYAPGVAVGLIDLEGFRWFRGPGLDGLSACPRSTLGRGTRTPRYVPDLFSDLNQWMLKILAGQRLPEGLISIPRLEMRSATDLAKAAKVSVMTASRLVNHLADEGFLDRKDGRIQLVRSRELLEQWMSANRRASRDVPVRFIVKKKLKPFFDELRRFAKQPNETGFTQRERLRCCVGVFAAADVLGFGFVRGVLPHLYLERIDLSVLRSLGLTLEDAEREPDVYLRTTSSKESVFRAAVVKNGLPVCDLLQVWLDASVHPSRGQEQAEVIWRRTLEPLLGK